MWPLFQPIRTLEILKLCEISWDLLKKYFHLKSNAVYNSSAKKVISKITTKPNWQRKENMDMKYTYILLLTVLITVSLVHGHISNPAAEIGWFMDKLVSRFSVNLNTHTHAHINTKHTQTHTPFYNYFFSPLFPEGARGNAWKNRKNDPGGIMWDIVWSWKLLWPII